MSSAIPSIACLGVIGKNNNPLHQTIFSSSPDPTTHPFANAAPIRTPLQFSLLLCSSLDIFEARVRSTSSGAASGTSAAGVSIPTNLSGDLGLLTAVDERLSVYGAETNTGVRFVAIVDMAGRRDPLEEETAGRPKKIIGKGVVGVRDGEVKVVLRAMQTAYVKLLQNPFHNPDEHSPVTGRGGKAISSQKFDAEMKRIGETWRPGMTSL